MQKITDKIAALPPGDVYHSLEFFPPKTEMVRDSGVIISSPHPLLLTVGACLRDFKTSLHDSNGWRSPCGRSS